MKNRKQKNVFYICAVALALNGCNTLRFQEPIEGERAKVRFVTTTKDVTVLRAYNDVSCSGQSEVEWMRLREGPLLNNIPKTLGLPLNSYHKNAFKEVFVPANKDINAMFVGEQVTGSRIDSCGVPFSYNFKDGKSYEVKFNWQTSVCSVDISEMVNTTGSWQLNQLQSFDSQINDKNQGCMQQFKKIRLF